MATSSGSSPFPQARRPADFRTQTYLGQPVLTFWQGTGLGGLSSGTDYIYNDHYQQIATVNAGNGLSADGHEFLITPWNTALILSYTTATADLTSIGGPANQTVINGVVQEIDIATGKVLFQWNSADHVPYSQSEQPLPASASTPWDWFHINAVKLDTRRQPADRRPRHVDYLQGEPDQRKHHLAAGRQGQRLHLAGSPGTDAGQRKRDIRLAARPRADRQQRVHVLRQRVLAGTPELPYSRAVTVKLNPWSKVATLVSSDNQPEGLSAASQGNAQTTGDGDLFVGWGILPYISEFDPAGKLIFNAEFPTGVNTYRAYLLPWNPPGSGQGGPKGPGGGQGGQRPGRRPGWSERPRRGSGRQKSRRGSGPGFERLQGRSRRPERWSQRLRKTPEKVTAPEVGKIEAIEAAAESVSSR